MKILSLRSWTLVLATLMILGVGEWLGCKSRDRSSLYEVGISGPETDLASGYGYHSLRAIPAQGECVYDANPAPTPSTSPNDSLTSSYSSNSSFPSNGSYPSGPTNDPFNNGTYSNNPFSSGPSSNNSVQNGPSSNSGFSSGPSPNNSSNSQMSSGPSSNVPGPTSSNSPQGGMRLVDGPLVESSSSPDSLSNSNGDLSISLVPIESNSGPVIFPESAGDINLDTTIDSRIDVPSNDGFALAGDLPGQSYSVELVTSESEMNRAVNVTASVDSTAPVLSGGFTARVRQENRDFNQYSYVVFKVVVSGERSRFRSPTLSQFAQEGVRNNTFPVRCGDRYVSGVRMGGILLGIARINKVEQSNIREVEAGLNQIRSNRAQAITGSANVRVDQRTTQVFSSASVKLYNHSNVALDPGTTVQSLLNTIGGFTREIQRPSSQKVVVAYLQEYRGVSGYQGGAADQRTTDIADSLRRAEARVAEAGRGLERIDAMSTLGQEGYANSRQRLQAFVTRVQQAITACRRTPASCDRAALDLAVPDVTLPADAGSISPSWRVNSEYWVPLPYPNRGQPHLRCNAAQVANTAYFVDGLLVTFRSNNSTGQADVKLRYYTEGVLSVLRHIRSESHPIPIIELGQDVDRIVSGSMTAAQAAALLNRAFVQRTRGDGDNQLTWCHVHD